METNLLPFLDASADPTPGPDSFVAASESARSFADNSLDLVRPIFLDGDCPMMQYC